MSGWIDDFLTRKHWGGGHEVNPYAVVDRIPLRILLMTIPLDDNAVWNDLRKEAYDKVAAALHFGGANTCEFARYGTAQAQVGKSTMRLAFGPEKTEIICSWRDPNAKLS